jgi:hypothetical protein
LVNPMASIMRARSCAFADRDSRAEQRGT